METFKLISMTDFVLEQEKSYSHVTRDIKKNPFLLIVDYAKFLQRPLTIQMFVPCDKNGNYFLEIPHKKSYKDYFSGKWQSYEDGKERVLFHGFNYNSQEQTIEYGGGCWSFDKNDIENQTIESFGGIEYKIELTSSAIKQIGL